MKLLICTDLDRTLLPNGPQSESELARDRFTSLVQRHDVTLAYVTGRDKRLVQKAIKNFRLPDPDYVIADVGSTIYEVNNQNYHHWKLWDDEIANDWQGKNHDELHALLKDFRDIRLQEFSKQKKHKLSYYVPLYIDHELLIGKIKSLFDQKKINANLIWSIDELANIGLLDILPASAGKRHAIEFLMKALKFDIKQTIFAGDSGNDISVMVSPIQSVLVANASDEVKKQAKKLAKDNKQTESLYIATGDYLGMNGNYSAGILEGIVHYVPEADEWIGGNNA